MNYGPEYWTNSYQKDEAPWDTGDITTPLKEYFDQLSDRSKKILIPSGGKSYEAQYLYASRFKNVYVVDISRIPLENLKSRCKDFPARQALNLDFFHLSQKFDLII